MANRGKADIELERLNQQQIAWICGVTARSVRDWADGPRNADGTYNAQEFVQWFITRTTGTDAEREHANQRERLAAAQAEKVETENRVRRGELMDAQEMIAIWSDVLAAVRAKFLSMPSKLGPQLVAIEDAGVIAERIREEVYAALSELADDSGGDYEDAAPAAEIDDQSVGGQIPETI